MRAEHLYIHVPFCGRRCVYCDFSIAVRQRVPVDEYLRALGMELDRRHLESDFDLGTLYLGGGTPSKLGAAGVRELMDMVRARARLRDGAEVTLEANPEDVTEENARGWMAAGVNRVSLGVQSFDENVLAWMHRTHSSRQAIDAVHVLRDNGMSNISVDIIFGMPARVPRSWRRDLDQVLNLGVSHVSVYGLTVEPHTPLGRWVARRDITETPEEEFENEFLEAHDVLVAAGFEHYEVSNYGRTEHHSRHNWAYWDRRPYGGIGPSAHEFDGTVRRWNASAYTDWVARLAQGKRSTVGEEQLAPDDIHSEAVYLSLRTNRGITISEEERTDVDAWIQAGWASIDPNETLRLTASGWMRLDAIANHLTLVRSRSYI
ncbi:MAG TPA: radical SAM family heme chaperone HemW [Gemmatimonadaceae bacterium]|nr:radical SAM family heme chaperone HemW [Gemmatimonadaceae bacterium]